MTPEYPGDDMILSVVGGEAMANVWVAAMSGDVTIGGYRWVVVSVGPITERWEWEVHLKNAGPVGT